MVRTQSHRRLSAAAAPLLVLAVAAPGLLAAGGVRAASPPARRPAASQPRAEAARLPLAFQANDGQAGPAVRYLAQAPGVTILFTARGVTLDLTRAGVAGSGPRVTLAFEHASPRPRITGTGRQPGTVSYFLGDDPARWHTRIPAYTQVTYRQIWPGIDAAFTAAGGILRYRFTLAPGASPAEIRLGYTGARRLAIGRGGALAITTPSGVLRDQAPASTQALAGRWTTLRSRYRLLGGTSFGFTLARRARRAAVIIDPALGYSTFLGGSVADSAFSVTADAAGDLYVFGQTASPDFPTTPGAYQRTMTARQGGVFFVSKLNPAGTRLIYSTFVGGTGFQGGGSGTVDGRGNAYVTGQTGSLDFPVTAGAYRVAPFLAATQSVVFKLNPDGSDLVYSTYLAPDLISSGYGRQIALGPGGSVIVTGNTGADYAPVTAGAAQPFYPGGISAGYVARLNPAGSRLIYATYLGAPVTSQLRADPTTVPECLAEGLAADAHGAAYIAADCTAGFRTTPGAYQRAAAHGGALLVKLSPAGRLDYATYWGTAKPLSLPGTSPVYYADIRPDAVVVDGAGDAYLVADAPGGSVPATPGAYATGCSPGSTPGPGASRPYCTAVAEFNPAGSGLVYSSYFGGDRAGNYDAPEGIAVDAAGNAYLTGTSLAKDIPVTSGAIQPEPGHFTDPFFLAALSQGGGSLLYASYFGGTSSHCVSGLGCFIAGNMTVGPVTQPGQVYLGGTTSAANFPVTPGSFQSAYPGGTDTAWAAMLHLLGLAKG